MTTASPASTVRPLDDEAQSLIDARLDTIERMLAGRTTRGDRLAIVREVESQIHDLLTERLPDDTDRDAVIAALARLDPPEAYQVEGSPPRSAIGRVADAPGRMLTRPPASVPRPPSGSTAARISAAVGFAAVATFFFAVPGFFQMMRTPRRPDGLLLILPPLLAVVYAQSMVAISFAAYSRFAGKWAIVGMSLGVIAAVLCAVGPLYLMIR